MATQAVEHGLTGQHYHAYLRMGVVDYNSSGEKGLPTATMVSSDSVGIAATTENGSGNGHRRGSAPGSNTVFTKTPPQGGKVGTKVQSDGEAEDIAL